jgi:hypothetical protein
MENKKDNLENIFAKNLQEYSLKPYEKSLDRLQEKLNSQNKEKENKNR